MIKRLTTISARVLIAAALLGGSSWTLAAPTAHAATPALTITLDCYSSRERTTIHNNRATTVTIRTVGSLYKPYSNEPFSVYRKLAAGKSVTYYTGSGASYSSSFTLTRRNIYNNTVYSEGARVTSSVGTFTKRC
jgi:hypothetical protein